MKKRVAWYRWEWQDPIHKQMWTACTVSIYEPTYDMPFVSVLISIANGGGKVLMRTATLEEAIKRTGMPEEAHERLGLAYTRSVSLLEGIKRDLRVIADVKSISPGAQIIRTDTGEILAEAERVAEDYNARET